ncbi:MAG TPA: hypothetical protein VFQ61_13670 [Polyangiaceae bacterium]|nr:hypothetical protein [Polyangiaceae bacterium]
MTNARAWITLWTALAGGGLLATGCGSDELTGPSAGESGGQSGGNPATGGTGGASGGRTSGGANTQGGSTTGGASTAGTTSTGGKATNLGKDCVNDTNCGTNSGLSCVTNSAIPQGICTAPCDTDSDCEVFSKGAKCDPGRFCFEGCEIGEQPVPKCHNRVEFGCRPVSELETSTRCQTEAQCSNGVCDEDSGTCVTVVSACLPTCSNDDDCSGGYCNLGTGECVDEKPKGDPIGKACSPDDDQCEGFCVGSGEDAFCSGYCQWGSPLACGWDGMGPADAACLFPPLFNSDPAGADAAFCGQLCDCDSDCRSPNMKCLSFAAYDLPELIDFWQRQGLCAQPSAEDAGRTLPTCDGQGGAGGGGNAGSGGEGGGAGNAGEPGSSGAGGSRG